MLAFDDCVIVMPAHGSCSYPRMARNIITCETHQLLLLLDLNGRIDLITNVAVILDEGNNVVSEKLVFFC